MHAGGQEFESLNLHHISVTIASRSHPFPIPNTKVKLENADGTYRATCWESRKLPVQKASVLILKLFITKNNTLYK